MRKSSVSKQSKHSSSSAASAACALRAAARTSCASARPAARLGDSLRSSARFGRDLIVRNDARHQPFSFASAASKTRPSSRISSATAGPTSRTSGAISAYAITKPEVLDRRAEAARFAADSHVGTARRSRARRRRKCRDLRDIGWRHSASASRSDAYLAVFERLRLVRALGRELARCRCQARTLFRRHLAGSTQRTRVVRRQSLDRFTERRPHRSRQRVQLLRTVQHDRRNRAVALDQKSYRSSVRSNSTSPSVTTGT